jgi:hypothetical protein
MFSLDERYRSPSPESIRHISVTIDSFAEKSDE